MVGKCGECEGTGRVWYQGIYRVDGAITTRESPDEWMDTCDVCGGTGRAAEDD